MRQRGRVPGAVLQPHGAEGSRLLQDAPKTCAEEIAVNRVFLFLLAAAKGKATGDVSCFVFSPAPINLAPGTPVLGHSARRLLQCSKSWCSSWFAIAFAYVYWSFGHHGMTLVPLGGRDLVPSPLVSRLGWKRSAGALEFSQIRAALRWRVPA